MQQILIIEDDPIYRELIDEALKDEGFETIVADNGITGIERARAYGPDLIVSDVVMEGADGYHVLSTLRNEPSTAGIPFIMITGWSSKGGQRQGMSLGADDYLSKPFNATELVASVRAQLQKKDRSTLSRLQNDNGIDTHIASLLPSELRGPLQTIIGFASVLDERVDALDRTEIRDAARQIYRSAFRIRKTTDNFHLFTQLKTLEKDPDASSRLRSHHTGEVRTLVEERVMHLVRHFGRGSDIKFRLSDGYVAMESPYLLRIVDELVTNACTFSPNGSPLEVITAFAPDRFGLAVTDHGRGMSPEQISLLDAFVQLEKWDYDQPGLGLGLAIVRKIAHLHGGALSIQSKPGVKTRISVELPRAHI